MAMIEVFMSDSTRYTDEFEAVASTQAVERGSTMWPPVDPEITVHPDT